MSPEEAIAYLLADPEGFTVSETPDFLQRLAELGFKVVPIERDTTNGEFMP